MVTEGGVSSQLYKRDCRENSVGEDRDEKFMVLWPDGHTVAGILTVEGKLKHNIMVT